MKERARPSKSAAVSLPVRIVMIGASILAALVVAELLTRIVVPDLAPARKGRVEFWIYDELLGWKHKPNQRASFSHPAFDIEVAINSAGLRDTEASVTQTGKRRALVLGDSFGWGFGVEHSERFDTLIEARHPGWEFINASVSGYGTDQQYLWLTNKGVEYRPELVLLLLYQNDFANNRATEQYWYYKPKFELENGELRLTNVPVPAATFSQRMKQLIIGRTYLYGYLFRTVVTPLNLRYRAAKLARQREQGLLDRPSFSAEEVTGALLGAINDFCRSNDIRFVLVSVPGESRYSEFLSDWSSRVGVDYRALDPAFAGLPPTDYLIPRDNHWNPVGHVIAADAIEALLQQLGVFRAPNG